MSAKTKEPQLKSRSNLVQLHLFFVEVSIGKSVWINHHTTPVSQNCCALFRRVKKCEERHLQGHYTADKPQSVHRAAIGALFDLQHRFTPKITVTFIICFSNSAAAEAALTQVDLTASLNFAVSSDDDAFNHSSHHSLSAIVLTHFVLCFLKHLLSSLLQVKKNLCLVFPFTAQSQHTFHVHF